MAGGDWPSGNRRHHPPGVFQVALERVQKGCRWRSIDDPMVEGQAEEHHRPLGDLSLIDHRLLDHPAHPQDAYLWGVNNRCKRVNPIGPQVGDGERPPGDLLIGGAPLTRFGGQVAGLADDLRQMFGIGPLDRSRKTSSTAKARCSWPASAGSTRCSQSLCFRPASARR